MLAAGGGRAKLNGTAMTAGSSLLDGNWHHYALVADRSRGKGRLYIDGSGGTEVDISSLGSITNTTAFIMGRDPPGTGYLDGRIGEVRLSKNIRYAVNFTKEVSQHEDDAHTVLLYHFNEGSSGTVFDMSAGTTSITDSGTRHNGTTVASPTWDWGPIFVSPVKILHEGLWHALDTSTELDRWGDYHKLNRYRARRSDPHTGRILGFGLSRADCPGLFVSPETIAGMPTATNSYDDVNVPFIVEGAILNPSTFDISSFHWMVFKAIIGKLYSTDAGHLYNRRLQNWVVGAVQLLHQPDKAGSDGFIGRFVQEIRFTMKADLQDANTP